MRKDDGAECNSVLCYVHRPGSKYGQYFLSFVKYLATYKNFVIHIQSSQDPGKLI